VTNEDERPGRARRAAAASVVIAVVAVVALVASACSGSAAGDADGGTRGTGPGGSGASSTGAVSQSAKCTTPPTDGVSDTEIKIGVSFPATGLYAPLAAVAKGWTAFIESANAAGGVKGHQITIVAKDDAYDFVKTKINVDQLVNDDKVFAIFNVLGTDNNLTIRPDLDKACVPDLYAGSPSPQLGDPATYPWMIGSMPTTATEALAYADYLKRNRPDAKVGILSENDSFGQEYVNAFSKAVGGTAIQIVGNETYDARQTDVSSQVSKLHAAGADAVLLAVTNLTCPTALTAVAAVSGWGPTTFLSNTCDTKVLMARAGPAATGVLSAGYLMDPADPGLGSTDAMKRFKTDGPKYGLSADDLTDPQVAYGWTMGDLLVQTLDASPSLDRPSVMQTAYHLNGVKPGLVLSGVALHTDGANDPYPVEALVMERWNVTYFEPQGGPVDFDGQTNSYVSGK
jgi:branched-chain amino acid transport system substrate-binding protein